MFKPNSRLNVWQAMAGLALCAILSACHMQPPIDVESEVMEGARAKHEAEQAKAAQAKPAARSFEEPSSQALFNIKSSKPKDSGQAQAQAQAKSWKFVYAAGSFTHQQNAESLAKALSEKGYQAKVETAPGQQEAKYYRVLLELEGGEAEVKAKLDELGVSNPQLISKSPR